MTRYVLGFGLVLVIIAFAIIRLVLIRDLPNMLAIAPAAPISNLAATRPVLNGIE
jgi:hypothetical protein